ncbi:MAG: hypothetical protein QOJ91_1381 [Sphingomonadales bacterium]|jgi:hypothetical protein|nr:hypothetical protein [Sphingomonadales bacterium]
MRLPVAFLLALTGLSTACAPAAAKPKLTPAEASATRLAFERGRLIYAYDRAAWQGSDDLVAKLPDYTAKVGGWIVDGPADAPTLVFYDQDEAAPHAVYIASFKGGRIQSSRVLGSSDDRSLGAGRKSMIAARTAAVARLEAASPVRCKEQPFNTVVLPPEKPGAQTLVYFLTPQSDSKAIPMGGHYRVEVAADGSAAKPKSLTETCLEMPFADSKGGRPAALTVSDLLDPVPTEVHVFSALAAGLPVRVMTRNERVWAVDGTGIKPVAGKRR